MRRRSSACGVTCSTCVPRAGPAVEAASAASANSTTRPRCRLVERARHEALLRPARTCSPPSSRAAPAARCAAWPWRRTCASACSCPPRRWTATWTATCRAGDTPSKRARRVERSVLEYLLRTACKTSPFSTLTAVGVGTFRPGADAPLVVRLAAERQAQRRPAQHGGARPAVRDRAGRPGAARRPAGAGHGRLAGGTRTACGTCAGRGVSGDGEDTAVEGRPAARERCSSCRPAR